MKSNAGIGTYVITGAVLLALTGLNIWLAQHNLGALNAPIALGIACVQAVLLAMVFMHLNESPRLTWIYFFSGAFFVAVLVVITLTDYIGRDHQPRLTSWENWAPTNAVVQATNAAPAVVVPAAGTNAVPAASAPTNAASAAAPAP